VATAGRALPSFGLLVLMFVLLGLGMLPLVVLAVPPILVTTYEAVRTVDPSPVEAARGMGMNPASVLLRVERPVALPLILSGLRSAAIQVVSTATIAAYVSSGRAGAVHRRRPLSAQLRIGRRRRHACRAAETATIPSRSPAVVLSRGRRGATRPAISPGGAGCRGASLSLRGNPAFRRGGKRIL
jgi:hypothetical protein